MGRKWVRRRRVREEDKENKVISFCHLLNFNVNKRSPFKTELSPDGLGPKGIFGEDERGDTWEENR
jgi:hypothetical protein